VDPFLDYMRIWEVARMNKRELLQSMSFGKRIAEEESDELRSYFVHTDQWRQVFEGKIDVVYGAKGTGKSAIYFLLLAHHDELNQRNIVLIPAENPRGRPVFKDLESNPPTSENEFRFLWKLFFLSLLGHQIREFGWTSSVSRRIVRYLEDAGLIQPQRNLRRILRTALDYARKIMKAESVEGGIQIDPTTGFPTGVHGKITFREPTTEAYEKGLVSVDELLDLADSVFVEHGYRAWILLDRLDVAFADTPELERNALRALFRAYLDILAFDSLKLKVFIRSDIWRQIESGFREASHITRTVTIKWDEPSIMNLIIRRIIQNENFCNEYKINRDKVLSDQNKQGELFYRIFPKQIDTGSRKPTTFRWMLTRAGDSLGVAPREIIHLLDAARQEQIRSLEIGGKEPPGEILFEPSSIKAALSTVSKVRLEQTLYAEYPEYKEVLERLRREKTEQTVESLAKIWGVEKEQAEKTADNLVEIGFFERRNRDGNTTYWVPFLYRDALEMVQGATDAGED
jgi:hypothetical protein